MQGTRIPNTNVEGWRVTITLASHMVEKVRIELTTSALSEQRSNQLSYFSLLIWHLLYLNWQCQNQLIQPCLKGQGRNHFWSLKPLKVIFTFCKYYSKNLRKNQIKWSVLPESNRAIVICSHSSNRLIQHAYWRSHLDSNQDQWHQKPLRYRYAMGVYWRPI